MKATKCCGASAYMDQLANIVEILLYMHQLPLVAIRRRKMGNYTKQEFWWHSDVRGHWNTQLNLHKQVWMLSVM